MRFVVFGAGAVGGSVAGLLSRAGHEAAVIARGAHLAAIRERGLIVKTQEQAFEVLIEGYESPAELAWRDDDVVLLGMKTQDAEPAMRQLPPGVPVVCLQNGVANE